MWCLGGVAGGVEGMAIGKRGRVAWIRGHVMCAPPNIDCCHKLSEL